MKLLLKVLLSAIAVFVLANVLPGITVENLSTSIWVALLLGVLNHLVKPVLVVFTIPLTILTLGFFLLVINAMMVMMAGYFIDGFYVSGILAALLFSVLLSICQSVLFKLLKEDTKKH